MTLFMNLCKKTQVMHWGFVLVKTGTVFFWAFLINRS